MKTDDLIHTAIVLTDTILCESPELRQYVDNDDGVQQLHQNIEALIEPVETCYALATDLGYDDPFDLEFVPDFLAFWLVQEYRDLPTIAKFLTADNI